MELATKYNPHESEDKWYAYWQQNKLFRSVPDEREPYTIVIPPPNVTGVLHMGHILNNTIQDVLVRRARMLGKNACWVPGTDHASIATEAKVVDKLRKEGINKNDLSRDEFLKHAWEWTHKHGGIILEQLKKLGASCDWNRTKFTMDDDLSESVIDVFINLYNKGLVYRGVRMVNWDPQALTAISDDEVIYREVQSKLYYVRYKVVDTENEWVTIATTRPETILGDTAVCFHPEDTRYQHLRGKKVYIPLINRVAPLIEDEYVEREFGTGCLKITPAHDINDYYLGIKHKLETIDIFNDNGTLNEKAQLFVGLDRFEVRKLIVEQLHTAGHIVKIDEYPNKVGYSERTHVAIEPKLSLQWFVKMKEMAKPALENVMNDNIHLIPEKYKNTYRHWMENVNDWCISRQLWWGHRIPAFYLPSGEIVVAKTIEEAFEKAKQQYGNDLVICDLRQDEDVLDTWFSSWLWPLSVFDGIRNPENADIQYYYPTNDLVTAPEILFFWVARMIMAGYEFRGEKPYSTVYLTGIVRDGLGRKMSKSLGNSPDPLDLIALYGADAVRYGMLHCSPAGNDLMFEIDEKAVNEEDKYPLCIQGRNFTNKIWNSFRLLNGWQVADIEQPAASKAAVEWFNEILKLNVEKIDEQFKEYRISDALMSVHRLIWEEFSSWYLEIIKPAYQQPIDSKTYSETLQIFENLLKLLHPFMPFITEELWHHLAERKDGESIMSTQMPAIQSVDAAMMLRFDFAKDMVFNIRNVRKDNNIALKEPIELFIKATDSQQFAGFEGVVAKLGNLTSIVFTEEKIDDAISFLVRTTECFVPFGNEIDIEAEIKKLQDELQYIQKFLATVMTKLSNENFVARAKPEVIDLERRKKSDAESKIKTIEERIEVLKRK